jgi:hypothetical protein
MARCGFTSWTFRTSSPKVSRLPRSAAEPPLNVSFVTVREVTGSLDDSLSGSAWAEFVAMSAREVQQLAFDGSETLGKAEISKNISVERPVGIQPKMVIERYAAHRLDPRA